MWRSEAPRFTPSTSIASNRWISVEPAIVPGRPNVRLQAPRVLVEIPRKIADLPQEKGLVAAWQTAARKAFEAYFARGYRLDDFISGERSYYVLRLTAGTERTPFFGRSS